MFQHSVKVPRHYKIAANIFKKVSTEGGSVKSLLYDDKLRHFRTNVLFALITETIKHAADLDKIFENTGIITNEPRLDPWLAKVLTSELLFGKKYLPGKSKPEETILSYKEQFEKYMIEHQDDMRIEVAPRPRYVRVNTNLFTTSDAIRAFQDEGYKFVRCTSGSYNDYLEQIQALSEYDFTQDYHVKTVYVFPAGTKLHEYELYLENKIILQDKATAMAVHLLAPPAGSTVLDMCAAPGMKTTQLAAYLRNEGKVYAVERNEKRYQTLCDFVEKTNSKCVETIHKDALEIKRGEYSDVEYILLDPSCSGSGMELCVHNYIEEERLSKLTSLQEKFLKHAMNSFPNAKKIVYSTCSIYPEENERVVTNAVMSSRAKWRVQDVKELLKGQWNNFGSGMYGTIGVRCMYAKPVNDLTIGFFLAVLERNEKLTNDDKVDEKKSKKEKYEINDSYDNISVDTENLQYKDEKDIEHAAKKRKKREHKKADSDEITEEVIEEQSSQPLNKKKKESKHKKADSDEITEEVIEEQSSQPLNKKKRESKHKKANSDEITEEFLEEQSSQPLNKKKKKGKHIKADSDEVSEDVFEKQISSQPSKKSKYVTSLEEDDISFENADSLEVPKKKKKKKHIIDENALV